MNRELKARIIRAFGTQMDFARLLGISEDRMSRIIHGRVTPKELERKAIAEKLNASEAELFPA